VLLVQKIFQEGSAQITTVIGRRKWGFNPVNPQWPVHCVAIT